jgi:hypothetical protein
MKFSIFKFPNFQIENKIRGLDRLIKKGEPTGSRERDFFFKDYLKKQKWLNHKKRRTVQKLSPRKES